MAFSYLPKDSLFLLKIIQQLTGRSPVFIQQTLFGSYI